MEILILAAGRSSRFKAAGVLSKVLMNFWGHRVIDILCRQAAHLGKITLMVNEEIAQVLKHDGYDGVNIMIQDTQHYGTGAAVQQYLAARETLKHAQDDSSHGSHLPHASHEQDSSHASHWLIIPGDLPLLDFDSMKAFVETDGDIVIGGMKTPEGEEQYGRIIIDETGVKEIVEYKFHEAKTEYVNTGVILIRKSAQYLIEKLTKNSANEIYLTDIVALAYENKLSVKMIELKHESALGFNTVSEFNSLLQIAARKYRKKHAESGAIFHDIDSVYFSCDTQIEAGAIIGPNCYFGPNVVIKFGAHIKAFSCVSDAVVSGQVGPFAHVRSGTIEEQAQVGAFVEMSKAHVGKKAKVKHLAYIGNVEIGAETNIGAGVVVCNYDGKKKHETKIGKGVMIGANSSLVAPMKIGDDAYLAAGGVYTDDILNSMFAIARARQENKGRRIK